MAIKKSFGPVRVIALELGLSGRLGAGDFCAWRVSHRKGLNVFWSRGIRFHLLMSFPVLLVCDFIKMKKLHLC